MGLRTGGCQCGAVRYVFSGEPHEVYVCHCLECRRQSASAFGISVIVSAADLRLTSGQLRSWSRPTSSGGSMECLFCPTCGSRLWHRSPGETVVSVKGGSLDEPVDLTGARHIWTVRKMPGVVLPADAVCFAEEPPTPPNPAATGS